MGDIQKFPECAPMDAAHGLGESNLWLKMCHQLRGEEVITLNERMGHALK